MRNPSLTTANAAGATERRGCSGGGGGGGRGVCPVRWPTMTNCCSSKEKRVVMKGKGRRKLKGWGKKLKSGTILYSYVEF